MRSNGFGRWEQRIIVHVSKEHSEQVAAILGVAPFKESGSPVRAYFEWSRLTTSPGDDGDIICDLSALLGMDDPLSWKVDWKESEY
ncbi:hypothetical protein N183_02350 [Sinorhizobium sp. Sb3]|nr:hypothetical protein N183_02350 [Sinorhizobium sp. Sb3]